MKEIFEKARSLANDLLDTEQGKNYMEARKVFDGDENAVSMLQDYGQKVQAFQQKVKAGANPESLEDEKAELDRLVSIMQLNSVVSNLFRTEGEFHQLVGNMMDVFNATIVGDVPDNSSSNCGGGCCGGCGCDDAGCEPASDDACGCATSDCSCGDNCECTPDNHCGCGGNLDCGCGSPVCTCGDNCECTPDNHCGCGGNCA